MKHDDEIEFLEYLGRGKKATIGKATFSAKMHSEKYQHFKKGRSQTQFSPRKAVDMVRIAQKKTQAIFKISSYGKGEERIRAHLRYITRNGKLELEDQDGNKLSESEDRKIWVKHWSVDFGNDDRSRDTMHLVLSTPPGTDRIEALKASKEFLADEYGKSGHEYVFVAHNDTDHPHIHAVIKMKSVYGKKLNPRKAYLRQVREHFAEKCRLHGIDVEASARCERGLSGASKRSEFVHMNRDNRIPYKDKELIQKIKGERESKVIADHPSYEKMLKRNQIIRKRYAEKANKLEEITEDMTWEDVKAKYLKPSMPIAEEEITDDMTWEDVKAKYLKPPKRIEHPSHERTLKRNRIIRKRYVEKTSKVEKLVNDTTLHDVKNKYLKASKLIDDFANEMPLEITRGEQVHRQLDTKYGVSHNRTTNHTNNEKGNLLDEYNAVTSGVKNDKGIYKSLEKILTQKAQQLISKEVTENKKKNIEKDQEPDIDIDD